jgi:hypothetical protein
MLERPNDGANPAWGVAVGGTVGFSSLPLFSYIPSLAIRTNYEYLNLQGSAGRMERT